MRGLLGSGHVGVSEMDGAIPGKEPATMASEKRTGMH